MIVICYNKQICAIVLWKTLLSWFGSEFLSWLAMRKTEVWFLVCLTNWTFSLMTAWRYQIGRNSNNGWGSSEMSVVMHRGSECLINPSLVGNQWMVTALIFQKVKSSDMPVCLSVTMLHYFYPIPSLREFTEDSCRPTWVVMVCELWPFVDCNLAAGTGHTNDFSLLRHIAFVTIGI